jgi:catechol 2,3-dioxygenase-like lactoylglutathione lyase family enzyme
MTLRLANVTIDCDDVLAQSQFWSQVLGRPVDDGANQFMASIAITDESTPTWLFLQVPESKAAKNRMHVDFGSDDREGEVERILGLGATRVDDHDEYGVRWTVLADPEGNEFCVGQPSSA